MKGLKFSDVSEGDIVSLQSGERVWVTHTHAGHYDYTFTGRNHKNKTVYFDIDDIKQWYRCPSKLKLLLTHSAQTTSD